MSDIPRKIPSNSNVLQRSKLSLYTSDVAFVSSADRLRSNGGGEGVRPEFHGHNTMRDN